MSVSNRSNSTAPESEIKYFFSSDANYDESDIELTTSTVLELTLEEPYQLITHPIQIPEGVAPGTWYILFHADPENLVEEEDETNNWHYTQVQIETYADLIMHPLQVETNSVMAGSSIFVSGSIKNLGFGNAPESTLKFYLSANDIIENNDFDIEVGEILVNALAYDEEFNFSSFELSIPFETGGGDWYIIAKADGEKDSPVNWTWGDVNESNEDNNTASTPLNIWRQPDLHFGNMRLTFNNAIISTIIEGSDINLAYEVWHSNGNMNTIGNNTGLSYADENVLNCYLSNNMTLEIGTDILLSSTILESTYGNARLEDNLTLNIPENLDGDLWYVIAETDANNSIDERDETNNIWVQAITVTDKPDLTLTNFQAEPNIIIPEMNSFRQMRISGIVKNINPVNNVPYARFYLYFSYDNELSSEDIELWNNGVYLSDDDSNEGEIIYSLHIESEYVNWPENLSHGNYYLICKTSTSNNAEESNENNNTAAIPFEIRQPVDLEISDFIVDHTTIQEGTDFNVSCTIRNNNATTSEPTTLSFSLDISENSNSSYMVDLETIQIDPIIQGEKLVINRTYTVPNGTWAYYLRAKCDEDNYNLEFNKENNKQTIPINISSDNPPLEVSVTIFNPTAFGASDGFVNSTVSGGTDPYNYTWYLNGEVYATGSSSLENISEGNYRLAATDNYGNSGENIFRLVAQNPLESIESIINHVSSYNGSDGSIFIRNLGGIAPISYSWSKNGEIYSNEEDISGLTSGTYSLLVTDQVGTTITEEYFVMQPQPTLMAEFNVINVSSKGANDGAVDLNIIDGAPPYTFVWGRKDFSYSNSTEDINGLAPGTYWVDITDNIGNKLYYEMNIQTLELLLNVSNISVNGLSDGSINVIPAGGVPSYTFEWTKDGVHYSNDQSIDNLGIGEYAVTAIDAYGLTTTETVTT